jgi:hypothetical protein
MKSILSVVPARQEHLVMMSLAAALPIEFIERGRSRGWWVICFMGIERECV